MKKILVIEDNELNMELFCDIIELSGYEAICLSSGITAITTALHEMPDLVIMDIQLPQISGIDLIKNFKEHHILKNIPIIAITAFAMRGDEEKIVKAGCERYLSKPIDIALFQANLAEFLGDN